MQAPQHPMTPLATITRLSSVQARIDALTREAVALRAHLLRLADRAEARVEDDEDQAII